MSSRTPSSNAQKQTPRTDGFSAWTLAALALGVEAAAIVGMAAWALYGVVAETASTTTRDITEAIVLLILAGGLGVLIRFLIARKSLAKTPSLVWNVLLLPVAWELFGGGARTIGIAVAVLALVGIGACLALPHYEFSEDEDET